MPQTIRVISNHLAGKIINKHIAPRRFAFFHHSLIETESLFWFSFLFLMKFLCICSFLADLDDEILSGRSKLDDIFKSEQPEREIEDKPWTGSSLFFWSSSSTTTTSPNGVCCIFQLFIIY